MFYPNGTAVPAKSNYWQPGTGSVWGAIGACSDLQKKNPMQYRSFAYLCLCVFTVFNTDDVGMEIQVNFEIRGYGACSSGLPDSLRADFGAASSASADLDGDGTTEIVVVGMKSSKFIVMFVV